MNPRSSAYDSAMDRQEFVDRVRAMHNGVVATAGPHGSPQAAYLDLTATDRGELVFNARSASRKIANICRDAGVAAVIGGPDGTTLQCEGHADLPDGSDRDRCIAAYLDTFPQFADSFSDDSVVVVRVTPRWIRFGDYRAAVPVSVEVDAAAWDWSAEAVSS